MPQRELDRAAWRLRKSPAEAQATVAALQSSFKAKGTEHSFDETAKIIVEALKHPGSDDPEVHYAAEWLKMSSVSSMK